MKEHHYRHRYTEILLDINYLEAELTSVVRDYFLKQLLIWFMVYPSSELEFRVRQEFNDSGSHYIHYNVYENDKRISLVPLDDMYLLDDIREEDLWYIFNNTNYNTYTSFFFTKESVLAELNNAPVTNTR